MYVPAFFEIFLGLVVLLAWSTWLRGRPGYPNVARVVPWVVGGVVLLGQAAAGFSLAAGGESSAMVDIGRWASVGAVGLGLPLMLVLTVLSMTGGSQDRDPASKS